MGRPSYLKHYLVVVNPHGGRKRGSQLADVVRPVLQSRHARLNVHLTEFSGHAQQLVHSLDLGAYDAVVVIGGDGTLHEIVNGMLTRRDGCAVPIGLIPGGSGNAFARDFDIVDPVQAAKSIIDGATRAVDVARVGMRGQTLYAVNVIGWGLVADISAGAERVRWLGRQRYNAATLVQIGRLAPRRARIVLDGAGQQDSFVFIMACNSQYTGKGMKLAPRARPDDGLIDVVMVRRASRIQLLRLFPKVFNGTHLASPLVEYAQLKRFSVEPEKNALLNVDGELKGSTPFEVDMQPGAIRVFV